jgi:hypothetical protein
MGLAKFKQNEDDPLGLRSFYPPEKMIPPVHPRVIFARTGHFPDQAIGQSFNGVSIERNVIRKVSPAGAEIIPHYIGADGIQKVIKRNVIAYASGQKQTHPIRLGRVPITKLGDKPS